MSHTGSNARTFVGKVTSNKMKKTLVVEIMRTVKDLKYGKILKKRSKFHVHDETQIALIGNTVRIRESRPLSKTKNWVLVEVIS